MTTINDILNEIFDASIYETNGGKVAIIPTSESEMVQQIADKFGLDLAVMEDGGGILKLHHYANDLTSGVLMTEMGCSYEDCEVSSETHITTPDGRELDLVVAGGDVAANDAAIEISENGGIAAWNGEPAYAEGEVLTDIVADICRYGCTEEDEEEEVTLMAKQLGISPDEVDNYTYYTLNKSQREVFAVCKW